MRVESDSDSDNNLDSNPGNNPDNNPDSDLGSDKDSSNPELDSTIEHVQEEDRDSLAGLSSLLSQECSLRELI